jgi:hypothetical protein
MRVIFLDIDGVLNSVDWMMRGGSEIINYEDGGTQLDPKAVTLLESIVKNSGAKVVISSTWRRMYGYEQVAVFLRRHGFTGEVIGETPYFYEPGKVRGDEIQAWLDEHPEVKYFAILDDDSDMAHLMGRLVHTKYPHGLLPEHEPKILQLLQCRRKPNRTQRSDGSRQSWHPEE